MSWRRPRPPAPAPARRPVPSPAPGRRRSGLAPCAAAPARTGCGLVAAAWRSLGGLQQMPDAVLLGLKLGQRGLDALLRERIQLQALHQLVLAVGAGDRKAEHDVFRNAVLAIRSNAHRDPSAVA